jgi:hypothetical protein
MSRVAREPRVEAAAADRTIPDRAARATGSPSTSADRQIRSTGDARVNPARVNPARAESSCARRAGRSDRPARAGWAALRQFRLSDIPLWGERWSSGVRGERWWRPPRRRARPTPDLNDTGDSGFEFTVGRNSLPSASFAVEPPHFFEAAITGPFLPQPCGKGFASGGAQKGQVKDVSPHLKDELEMLDLSMPPVWR